jgi:hypothetical protein
MAKSLKEVTMLFLDDVERDWKELAPTADVISKGRRFWWRNLLGGSIDPAWLHYYLYLPNTGLQVSVEQRKVLDVLKHLRQMDPDSKFLSYPSGSTPTDQDLLSAFELMAEDAQDLVLKVWRVYGDHIVRWGAVAEKECVQWYGEPCQGKGARIIQAEVTRLLKGTFPYSDAFENTLRAWRVTQNK